jgi:hypothetical protein
MSRRVSLPAADDLFRRTGEETASRVRAVPDAPDDGAHDAVHDAADDAGGAREPRAKKPSGRIRHDEKMTVYVTSDELLDIEHARLSLRRTHGLAVDRGRLVREAVALVLADFEARGHDSVLVQRLIDE